MGVPEHPGYGMFPGMASPRASELVPHSAQLSASPLTMTPTSAKLFSYFNVYLDTLKASYWGKYKLVVVQMCNTPSHSRAQN